MKPIVNQAAFDSLVEKLIISDGITKEAATKQVQQYFDVAAEFVAMKRETWKVLPNRADRRKRNK